MNTVYGIYGEYKIQIVENNSWFKSGSINKASRIDFALVSGGIDQKVKTVMYIPGIKTDHRAIYMCVDLSYCERGKGFWKLNTKLLQNLDYIQGMNKELESTVKLCENKAPQEGWEVIKE